MKLISTFLIITAAADAFFLWGACAVGKEAEDKLMDRLEQIAAVNAAEKCENGGRGKGSEKG